MENLALHPQQPSLDRGGPAKSPEERLEAMHELLLLGQVLGDDRVLEGPPCRKAFRRDRRFPCSVFDPVLLSVKGLNVRYLAPPASSGRVAP